MKSDTPAWKFPLPSGDHAYNVADARDGELLLVDPLAHEAIESQNKECEQNAQSEAWSWQDPDVVHRQEGTWIDVTDLAADYIVRFYLADAVSGNP